MTISITNCYSAIRGLGSPLRPDPTVAGYLIDDEPPFPPADDSIAVSLPAQEGWFNKTIQYRHSCLMNIANINKQLTDGKKLDNRGLLEHRKEFLMSEVNVCHRMLTLFSKELN